MAEEIRVEVEGGTREPKRRGGCLRTLLLLPGYSMAANTGNHLRRDEDAASNSPTRKDK